MAQKNIYLRGQGALKVATYGSNAFRKIGEVDALTLSPTVETLEHIENQTGKDFTDLRFHHTPKLGFAFSVKNITLENAMMALWGVKATTSAGSITVDLGAVLPGFDYRFGAPGATVTSATAGVEPLVAGTDYTVNKDGTIAFEAALTDVEVVAAETEQDYITLMGAEKYEVSLLFDGLNSIDGKRVTTLIGRSTIMPAQSIALISKELISLDLEGMALYDPTQPQTGLLGGYGSMTFHRAPVV